jgi:hypothetical protein
MHGRDTAVGTGMRDESSFNCWGQARLGVSQGRF